MKPEMVEVLKKIRDEAMPPPSFDKAFESRIVEQVGHLQAQVWMLALALLGDVDDQA